MVICYVGISFSQKFFQSYFSKSHNPFKIMRNHGFKLHRIQTRILFITSFQDTFSRIFQNFQQFRDKFVRIPTPGSVQLGANYR